MKFNRIFLGVILLQVLLPFSSLAHEEYYQIDPNTGNGYYLPHSHNDAANQVSITTDSNFRYITSNGIPYWHGQFPNAHNPNAISPQNYHFRIPLHPQFVNNVTQLWGGMVFGVGLDGVPFDPGTAEFWNRDPNWRYEAMSGKINLGIDQNNAHVQPGGAYHYHALPTELTNKQNASQHSAIIGYAADGFPIYARYGYAQANDPSSGIKELTSSYQLHPGMRPSGMSSPGGAYDGTFTADFVFVNGAGDLDECNGRLGITPDYPEGTYAYFITMEFPLIPRCFKGEPDRSFVKQNGPGRQGGGGMGGMRPPPPPPFR